jgi:hypothetical protein
VVVVGVHVIADEQIGPCRSNQHAGDAAGLMLTGRKINPHLHRSSRPGIWLRNAIEIDEMQCRPTGQLANRVAQLGKVRESRLFDFKGGIGATGCNGRWNAVRIGGIPQVHSNRHKQTETHHNHTADNQRNEIERLLARTPAPTAGRTTASLGY